MSMKTETFRKLLGELARQHEARGDHETATAIRDLAKVFDPATNPNLDRLVEQIRRVRQIKAA